MKGMMLPVAITALWSIAMVHVMHDRVGIGMGICIGTAFGPFESGKKDEDREGDEKR